MVKYKLYRNKILTLSRLGKKLWYHNFFEAKMSDIKHTWRGINLQNRKTRGDSVITALKRPGNGELSQNNKKNNADELPNKYNDPILFFHRP